MIQKTILPNGLTVLMRKLESNDIVALSLLARAGSRYEDDSEAGWHDLSFRLLTRGTEHFNATELSEAIDASGARIAGHAGRDAASVSLVATRQYLDQALDLFFEVALRSAFPGDKVEQEKEMQLRRIAAMEDQLLHKAVELLTERHFGQHPYHRPHLGYRESIAEFNPEAAAEIHQRVLVPNNLVLAAAGNFSPDELCRRIETELGPLATGELPCCKDADLPARPEPVLATEERDSEAAWIALGYDAPEIGHEDYAAVEVLDAITGGGMDSRLFTELRDRQGLAYQVSSSYVARPGPSLFMAYMGTRAENFDRAHKGILAEFARIAAETPPEDEVRRSQTYLKGTFIMGQESNSAQAGLMSQYELFGLGYDFADKYPGLIDAVRPEDVRRVAEKYLSCPYTLGAIVSRNQENAAGE